MNARQLDLLRNIVSGATIFFDPADPTDKTSRAIAKWAYSGVPVKATDLLRLEADGFLTIGQDGIKQTERGQKLGELAESTKAGTNPPPLHGGGPNCYEILLAEVTDIEKELENNLEVFELHYRRRRIGVQTYGEELQAFNGRNPIVDALEELSDSSVYLSQAIHEAKRRGEVGTVQRLREILRSNLRDQDRLHSINKEW